jgi:hypothetical protein
MAVGARALGFLSWLPHTTPTRQILRPIAARNDAGAAVVARSKVAIAAIAAALVNATRNTNITTLKLIEERVAGGACRARQADA